VRRVPTPVHSNILLRVDIPSSKDGWNKSERARKSGQRVHRGRRDDEAAECERKMLAMMKDRVSPRLVGQTALISSF
jgi:hypothetical protein